jgi:hypothetical protein
LKRRNEKRRELKDGEGAKISREKIKKTKGSINRDRPTQ